MINIYNSTTNKHFYFGPASIPFHVKDNIYQIKCLYRVYETGDTFEIAYLQFNIASEKYLEMLEMFKTDFIKYSLVECHPNQILPVIRSTGRFTKPKIIYPSEYERPKLQKAWNKLKNMALQKRPAKIVT